MALGFDHWEVEVTFVDKGTDRTTRKYALKSTVVDAADVATAAAALLTDIGGVTLCAIGGYAIREVFTEGALVLPSDNGARVSMEAIITGTIVDNPLKSATITIPGPKADVFQGTVGPSVDIVDPTDAVVTAFLANFIDTGDFTVSDGEQFDAAAAGFQGIRRTKFRRLA